MKIITLILLLSNLTSFAQLENIKRGKFDAFKELQDSASTTPIDFQEFQISNEVSVEEYSQFIEYLKMDSSNKFLSFFPESYTFPLEFINEMFYNKKHQKMSISGISWINAMEFCKWKTLSEQDSSNIKYIYRLPTISEWLYARHLSSNLKELEKFDSNLAEWTINAKDESHYFDDFIWSDYFYPSKKTDPLSLKRKIAIGNSYLISHNTLADFINYSYYEQKGYSHIGFRYVKVYILENDINGKNFNINNWLLKKWNNK
jgi:hypothetical protein